jgi:acyl carrier protein
MTGRSFTGAVVTGGGPALRYQKKALADAAMTAAPPPSPVKGDFMLNSSEVASQVIGFIRRNFLDGDPKDDLNESSPLLEWGILNSMNMIQLMNFVRDQFGVSVPPARINGRDFKDVRSITAMVVDLREVVRP